MHAFTRIKTCGSSPCVGGGLLHLRQKEEAAALTAELEDTQDAAAAASAKCSHNTPTHNISWAEKVGAGL
jgi:hypothetical protein